jgi:hypothetical protein
MIARMGYPARLLWEIGIMKRAFLLAVGAVSLVVSAAVSGAGAPAAGLSAAQIVERNVAARGGLQAWRAVSALELSGRLDAGGTKSVELPFVMKMKRPYKSRLEIRFNEQTALQIYDGEHGWKVRPFLNREEVEPYTQAEVKSAATWQELDGPLVDYAAKGSKIDLEGKEAVEGHDAYKIKLTLKDGTQRRVWIDAASFLELKIDGEPRKIDGRPRKVTIYYRDYRKENGLNMPRVLETAVEGVKQTHKMTIERVAVNQPMEDALFAKPQVSIAAAPAQ